MNHWSGRVELFKATRKIGIAQARIAERRIKLYEKLKKHVSNERDKRILEIALRGKNCTPRYW